MGIGEVHRSRSLLKTKDSVQPLLRSPFTGANSSHISKIKADWPIFGHQFLRHREVCDLILTARIGGAFWQAEEKRPSEPKKIVVLSSDPRQAERLWHKFTESFHSNTALVIFPPCQALKPLLREIVEAGALIAPAGNPYPILDIASSVYADGYCDLAMLAALAEIPAFNLHDSGFHQISPYEISARIDEGTFYVNPFTAATASIEEIVEILSDWRRVFTRNRAIGVCAGISIWKRKRIKQLLYNGETSPPFRRSTLAVLRKASARAVGAWATRMPAMLESKAHTQDIQVIRLEDGFIRSFGLGSALTAPASIVADRRGIYLDPAQPSDLEVLLTDTIFSESLKQRASRLAALLTTTGVSKYGFGGGVPAIRAKPEQRIILVPGQVADDLSLRLGAQGPVRTNLDLLRKVRQRNPDAFIIYRPHPDVMAGYRPGAIPNPVTSGLADQLIADGAIAALINAVDEVHTITSLAGFEALLRGRIVETYGQPFYAGWGLTKDHFPVERRQRRLTLEELVAGTLILYPNYVDPVTGLLCGPEILITRLAQPELWRPNFLMRLKNLEGQCRRIWAGRPKNWTRSDA